MASYTCGQVAEVNWLIVGQPALLCI